jgi:Tol biopolymer transport system component
VARTSDGGDVGFQVNLTVPVAILGAGNSVGRPRWVPDRRGVAYIAQDDQGGYGLYLEPFDSSSPATAPRRLLASFDTTASVESFGISPDGSRITLAVWEQLFSVMIARNVSDLITRGPRR